MNKKKMTKDQRDEAARLYLNTQMSSTEIAKYILDTYGVEVSASNIRLLGKRRNGRKPYDRLTSEDSE